MSTLKRTVLMVLALNLPISAMAEIPARIRSMAAGKNLSSAQKTQLRSLNAERKAKIATLVATRRASARGQANDPAAKRTIRASARQEVQAINRTYIAKAQAIIK